MSRLLTPLHRALRADVLAALIGAAGVAVVAGGCAGRSATVTAQTPTRTRPLETIFEAPTEPWENPGGTLDELKRLGVDRVKVYLHWADVAPDPGSRTRPHFDASSPAAYPAAGWAPFDAIIRAAAARGVGLDLTLLARAPLWATGPGLPPHTTESFAGAWKPSAREFEPFVRAVADEDHAPGERADGRTFVHIPEASSRDRSVAPAQMRVSQASRARNPRDSPHARSLESLATSMSVG